MSLIKEENIDSVKTGWSSLLKSLLVICTTFYLFFLSIELLQIALGSIENDVAKNLVSATSNPFIGILIGLLATAILQSSSAITSIIATVVGAGTLGWSYAIYIIIGANIGTTVTSTIFALAYIGNRKTFSKAIEGAVLHDFFNIFTAFIIVPLELSTGFLQRLSLQIAGLFYPVSGSVNDVSTISLLDTLIKPAATGIQKLFPNSPYLYFFLAAFLLVAALKFLASFSRDNFFGREKESFEKVLFANKKRSWFVGLMLTSVVQSSSVTSSLIVPLTATSKISLSRAYAYLMGVNLGTTVTALIAALALQNKYALAVATAHLLFNALGNIFYLVLPFKALPLWYANKLGYLGAKNRMSLFFYLLTLFFIIPFLLIVMFE